MSKQTSTEWLFKKLWDKPKDKLTWYAILKQAEEMEKERMFHFAIWYSGMEENKVQKAYERYLTETFNK